MIKVFGQTDKNYTSNGDIVLKPLKAKVHKEDNGAFYLDLETGLEYVDYLVEGNIIVANTPTGDQAFRISSVTKTRKKISFRAWHVYYDAEDYLIVDSYVVEKNCNDALAYLNAATDAPSPFETYSDITDKYNYRCVRKSLSEAVTDVLGRWGGHLVRDNYKIEIRGKIGADRGVTVQYRKNLQEITCEEDWSKVVTKLLPVGKDGLMLPGGSDAVDRRFVYSRKQYAIPYTKTVSFTQTIAESDFSTKEAYENALLVDLYWKAIEYVEENSVPKVNYKLKAHLDNITDIGDTVEVIDYNLGLDLMTEVIAYDYDCITGRYTQLEFGNFRRTLSDLLPMLSNTASGTNAELSIKISDASTELTQKIESTSTELTQEISTVNSKADELDARTQYTNGDTESFAGAIVPGITNVLQHTFTIPLPKLIGDLTPTLSKLMINVYTVDGTHWVLPYTVGGYDALSIGAVEASGAACVNVTITVLNSGTAGQPITVVLEDVGIGFEEGA